MQESAERSKDVISVTLAVLCIAASMLGSFWVIRPFFFAFLWATLIVIPTWPLMERLCGFLGGRRGLSVALATILLLLLVLIPLWIALGALVDQREVLISWITVLETQEIPPPPSWIAGLPVVGGKIAAIWTDIAHTDKAVLLGKVAPYLREALTWLVAQIGSVGLLLVHFILTVILAAVLFLRGTEFARAAQRFARRLGGARGVEVTVLAAQAVKAVAMGVVVTALAQGALAGVSLWITGIPYPWMLSAIVFFLAVVQVGAAPVLIPSIIWLFWSGQSGAGAVLLVSSLFVMGVDNVLRPILIKRGANLPLLLIFAGVIGGLFAFGIIGLFIGPIVLAVSYTLLTAWVNEIPHPET